jgi:IS66 Orf2 like protein
VRWTAHKKRDLPGDGGDRHVLRVRSSGGAGASGDRPGSSERRLFIFRSRRGDRLKILTWDRDGFVLWYKRLEAGVFKLPRVKEGSRSVELCTSELAMILDGIDMKKLKRAPRYERGPRTNGDNKGKIAV